MGFCVRLFCLLSGVILSPVDVRGALLVPIADERLEEAPSPSPQEVKNAYLRHLLSRNELFVHHSDDPESFLKVLTNPASRAPVPDTDAQEDTDAVAPDTDTDANTDTFARMLSMSVLPSHLYPQYPRPHINSPPKSALFFFDGSKCLAPLAYAPCHHSLHTGVGGARQTKRYHLQREVRRRWFLEHVLKGRKLLAARMSGQFGGRRGEDFMPTVKLTPAGMAFLQEDGDKYGDLLWKEAEKAAWSEFGLRAADLFEEGRVDFGEHVEGSKGSISEILVDCPSSALLGVAPHDHNLAPTISRHALEILLADAGYPRSLVLEPVPGAIPEAVGEQPVVDGERPVRDGEKAVDGERPVRDGEKAVDGERPYPRRRERRRLGGVLVAMAGEELRPGEPVASADELRPVVGRKEAAGVDVVTDRVGTVAAS